MYRKFHIIGIYLGSDTGRNAEYAQVERQGRNQEGRKFQNKGAKDNFKQLEVLRLTPESEYTAL